MSKSIGAVLGVACLLQANGAWAEEACPPDREAVFTSWWGGICYVASALQGLKTSVGEAALETTDGPVKVTSSSGRYVVSYPTKQLQITERVDFVQVDDSGELYEIRLGGGDGVLSLPGDKIRFRSSGDGVVISGGKGTVTVTSRMDALTISSSAGTTRFSYSAGSSTRTGPPPAKHAYMNRGLMIGSGSVSVYLRLDMLFGDNGPKLDWSTVRTIR